MTRKPHEVIIVTGAQPGRWPKALEGRNNVSWVYFGRDLSWLRQTRERMPKTAHFIDCSERINRIARQISPDFINLDRHIDVDLADVMWETADLAERSPATSDFFFNCCICLAFEEILGSLTTDIVVFLPNEALGHILARIAANSAFSVKQFSGRRFYDLLPNSLKSVLHSAALLIFGVCQRLQFIREFRRNRAAIARQGTAGFSNQRRLQEKPDIIMVTWAESDTFVPGEAKTFDQYYGNLIKALRNRGMRVGFLVNPYPLPLEEVMSKSESVSEWVLFPDECWGWWDMIKSLWTTLFDSMPISSPFVLKGLDLTEVLKEEIRVERSKTRRCLAMRHLYVGRYLKDHGVRPKTLVFPYENQPWEKALRLGMKAYLPETAFVGYMHIVFAPLWLSVYPSQEELTKGRFPDILVTSGPLWSQLLLNMGVPEDKIQVGPALRFRHIFERLQEPDRYLPRNGRDNQWILVAAPSTYDYALDLVEKVVEALHCDRRAIVLIKLHPDMGKSEGTDLLTAALHNVGLTQLPDHFSLTDQPVSELLDSVDVVIENGSSVGIEAVAAGLPVIHVPTDLWFDIDKLEYFPAWSVTARTADKIRLTVNAVLLRASEPRPERLSRVNSDLCELLQPPVESAVERFCTTLIRPFN